MNKIIKCLLIIFACLSTLFLPYSCTGKNATAEEIGIREDTAETVRLVEFAVTLEGDTVRTETFNLKNGYTLTFLLTKTEGQICSGGGKTYPCPSDQNARLTGKDIDTIVMSVGISQLKYLLRFDNIDFDDYFAIENSGGGNFSLYTNVFDKHSGKLILEGHAGTYDTRNDLVLFQDDENNGAVMLYDLKRNKKTEIQENYNDYGFGSMGAITAYKIDKVTPENIYVGFYGGVKKKKYTFIIPRNKMEDAGLIKIPNT